MCNQILVTTFYKWLRGTEPWRLTPGTVRPSVLIMFVVCLRAHMQFSRFDKADATADVQ